MSSKCINVKCTSSSLQQLEKATWSACNYYNIQFKPYHWVCAECLKKSDMYADCLRKCMINQRCVFDISTANDPELIDLTNEDNNNVSTPLVLQNDAKRFDVSTANEPELIDLTNEDNNNISTPFVLQNDAERMLASMTNSILNYMKPLITKQLVVCKNQVKKMIKISEQKNTIIKKNLNNLDNQLVKLHNTIFESYSSIQYEHQPEVNIDNLSDFPVLLDFKHLKTSAKLCPKGPLLRRDIKTDDKVYVNRFSGSLPWVEGTVVNKISSDDNARFQVKLREDERTFDFSLKKLAYNYASSRQFVIGTRVIAICHDINPNMINKFYAGIIAEEPTEFNSFRYLIFFDGGYAQYAYHREVRLVCFQSLDVSDDVNPNSKSFIKYYLTKHPKLPMVKFRINQWVCIDYEGLWHQAKVVNIDASLVQLKFNDSEIKHTEWIYRGSSRLEPIYRREMSRSKTRPRTNVLSKINKTLNKPYVEFEYEVEESLPDNHQPEDQEHFGDYGTIKTLSVPSDCPQPITFKNHKCSYFCLSRVKYNYDQATAFSSLSIPLRYGFQRSVVGTESLEPTVMYITPCGREICNENEMYSYLKDTHVENHHSMTIDMFNFDLCVNPLNIYEYFMFFIFVDDISGGLEPKPISAINSFDALMPPKVEYITKRKIGNGVKLNLDEQFLSGCDCIDNCENKKKCSCWQLTINGKRHNLKSIGYQFKRLYERVDTGIFECNTNCKCSKTCLNRVAQQPISTMLQVFKTKNKGWGLRTLVDIPKGNFICNYVGELFSENDAETTALNSNDHGEYLSNLDFIETVVELKYGYEKYVVNPPDISLNLGSVETNESRMCLRSKNIQHSNTEFNSKHKLSKLNFQQTTTETLDGSFYRRYFDKDGGIYVVDSKNSGNVSRYFNHSCDPNVFVQNVFVDTHDLRFPWQAYFASSFISSGTELMYDYGYEVGSVNGVTVFCKCESKNCIGRLL